MLSILIPVYNWSVTPLVQYLHQQCMQEKIAFEIILLDDQSTESWKKENRKLAHLAGVQYEELPKNIGRARIRNLLATKAQYPYLLFLDADAAEGSPTFIKKYLSHLDPQTVLYGGCSYQAEIPKQESKLLHYYYGKHREVLPLKDRQTHPYHAFKTFNFLIPKAIFTAIQFDESIREYGHEDTLFGLELEKRKIPIIPIDNPLEHAGLESFDQFLAKQQKALATLYQLYKNQKSPRSKLLQVYERIKKWKIERVLFQILDLGHPMLLQQLKRHPSRLVFLDLYKLHYWLQLQSQEK